MYSYGNDKIEVSSIKVTSKPVQIALVYSKRKEDIDKIISDLSLNRQPREQSDGGYSVAFESALPTTELQQRFDLLGVEVLFKQYIMGHTSEKENMLH
jgi:hypothetical protein